MMASLWVQLILLLHGSAPVQSLREVRHWFIFYLVDQVSSSSRPEIRILQTGQNPRKTILCGSCFLCSLSCRNRNETITKLYGTKMDEYFRLNHCLQKNLRFFFPSDQKYTRRQRCRHTCWLFFFFFFFCSFLNKVGRILRQREEWRFCCVVSF